jgi:hypothetical protein
MPANKVIITRNKKGEIIYVKFYHTAKISFLPENIDHLPHMLTLDLSRTSLQTLLENICNLP